MYMLFKVSSKLDLLHSYMHLRKRGFEISVSLESKLVYAYKHLYIRGTWNLSIIKSQIRICPSWVYGMADGSLVIGLVVS